MVEFYDFLREAYRHFNEALFEGKLPECLITVQREKNVMGYFSADRWSSRSGEMAHEIAINPAYFATHRVIEVFQTLVHEMCHLWQHAYGQPSRSCYHNKEWAIKMESLGLMPSSTGAPGGKRTGQKMSDYPLADGRFEQECNILVSKGFVLTWVDRRPVYSDSCQNSHLVLRDQEKPVKTNTILNELLIDVIPNITSSEDMAAERKARSKAVYQCGSCGNKVWGKPSMNIVCGDCNKAYSETE